jgi:hypothetical protein
VVPLVTTELAKFCVVPKRFVKVAMLAKRFVEVAAVVVPAVAVKVLRYAWPALVSAVVDAYPSVEVPVRVRPAPWMVPVKVGDALKTTLPVPVSSVRSAASSLEVSIEVEDTLLLKIVQSAAVRQPKVEPFAVAQVRALAEFVRPEPKRLLNVLPPRVKFVAVMPVVDAYDEDAKLKNALPETVSAVADAFASVVTPVKVGDALKTTFPVPVSSVSHCANCAEFEKKVEVATESAPLEITSEVPVMSVR